MAKFFVFLSVATIAGAFALVEGCSSSDPAEPPTETDAGDSSSPAPQPRDAAAPDAADAGPQVCPTTNPIKPSDLALQWMPPPPIQPVQDGGGDGGGDGGDDAGLDAGDDGGDDSGADGGAQAGCTQTDIDKLKAAFAASTTGTIKYSEIKTALGATCTACAFSPLHVDGGLATTWSVFVELDGGAVDNHTASCFAHSVDAACGKARFDFEACLRMACRSADCQTEAKMKQCRIDAQDVACKDITDVYVAACANESALLSACTIYGSIAVQCAGGLDSGIDASP